MTSDPTGNGDRLQKAAENALLILASRWFVIIGLPLIAAMGTFIGKSVWDDVREMKATLQAQYVETNRTISGLDVRLSVTETRVENLEKGRR